MPTIYTKPIRYLLLPLLLLLLLAQIAIAQNNFYLIDTSGIPLQKLSEDDRNLLQQNLELFHNAKNDTVKIKALMGLADGLNNDLLWPLYNRLAYELAKKFLQNENAYNEHELKVIKANLASSTGNIGFSLINKGEMTIAHRYFEEALALSEAINSKEQIASSLNNIGYIYEQQGNIPEALQRYHRSVKIKEEIGDKAGFARTLNNIAVIHKNIEEDFAVALPYFKKCEKIFNELGDNNGLGYTLNNIGDIYLQQNYNDEALNSFEKCYQLFRQTGNERGMFFSLMNIGRVQYAEENYEGALQSFTKAKEQNESINDKEGLCQVLIRLSETRFQLNQKEVAKQYGSSAYRVATELGVPDHISNATKILSAIYSSEKNWEQALHMKNIHVAMKDSIHNESNKKRTYQQLLKYEYGKKHLLLNAAHEQQMKVAEAENKKQKAIIYSVAGFLTLAIMFVGFIFRQLRITRQQKKIIEEQKNLVEIKKEEMTDSINCAQVIQENILPSAETVKKVFPHSVIFYKPKDIVSGDFYFYEKQGDNHIIAVADCMGHGVPGAFMSMLSCDVLSRIINDYGLTQPSLILEKLHHEVINAFSKGVNSGEAASGMDIALCSFNFEKKNVQFAGARRPLYHFKRNGKESEFIEIKGDMHGIGNTFKQVTTFTNHTIPLHHKNAFYMCSDGLSDQFGGNNDKRYTSKNLKKFLMSIQNSHIEKHHELLENELNNWKKDAEQTDDMLLIGIKYRQPKYGIIKIDFTESEILFLKNFLPQFKTFNIYSTGDIVAALEKIIFNSENIRLWKRQVEKAAFDFDEEGYAELMAMMR